MLRLTCVECGAPFERPGRKSRRVTCSRPCAVALSWKKNPEKRCASISKAKGTPEGRRTTIETNRIRWSAPGVREKLADWNRRRWADPATKARLSRAISDGWTPERRARFSVIRTAEWAFDADYRARTVAGIRRSKGTPEARALFSALLRRRWADPAWREVWLAGMLRRCRNPGHRERLSEALRKKWRDPAWRSMMLSRGVHARQVNGSKTAVQVAALVETVVAAEMARPTRKGFSMLAMQGPDPMRELKMRQIVDRHRGRV